MQTQSASLPAGLLARKGEARPSAQGETIIAARGCNVATLSGVVARQIAVATSSVEGPLPRPTGITRCIELPRPRMLTTARRPAVAGRRQVHARVDGDLHLRLKIAAARLGRTQQDLVASAMDAYLSSIDGDDSSPPSGVTNAGD